MAEHGIDPKMFSRKPETRDHRELRDKLESMTPLEEGARRSAMRLVTLTQSLNFSSVGITRFQPKDHHRSTYVAVFNPKHRTDQEGKAVKSVAKALIVRPELHDHEYDHVILVSPDKVEEMLNEFEGDPFNPKFRPKKLRSARPEDVQKHRTVTLERNSQITTLLRLLETALQPPAQETPTT